MGGPNLASPSFSSSSFFLHCERRWRRGRPDFGLPLPSPLSFTTSDDREGGRLETLTGGEWSGKEMEATVCDDAGEGEEGGGGGGGGGGGSRSEVGKEAVEEEVVAEVEMVGKATTEEEVVAGWKGEGGSGGGGDEGGEGGGGDGSEVGKKMVAEEEVVVVVEAGQRWRRMRWRWIGGGEVLGLDPSYISPRT